MRGRPPRAGTRATRRIEIRVTDVEWQAVHRLAGANGCSVADILRLGSLWLAAHLDEDEPPLVLGGRVCIIEAPSPDADELLPGRIRTGCASCSQEGTPS
jgi:hypothetical protein